MAVTETQASQASDKPFVASAGWLAGLGATVVLDVHVGTYGYPGLSASATGTSGASADGTSVGRRNSA